MDRILAGTQGTLTLYLRDVNGTLIDATGTPTAVVYDSSGAVAQASTGTAHPSLGTYTITVPPSLTSALDEYSVVWTAVSGVSQTFTTYFETCGGYLFAIGDIQNAFSEIAANPTTYTAAKIADARSIATERIELLTNVAFVPRGRRIALNGSRDKRLLVPDLRPRTLVSASIDGVALTSPQIAAVKLHPFGVFERTDGTSWSAQNALGVSLFYTYGYDRAPAPITRAAMLLARALLVPYNVPDRATAISTDEGTFQLSTPGIGGSATGIPEVDAILREFSTAISGIA